MPALVFAKPADSCLERKQVDAVMKEFTISKTSHGVNIDLCDSRSMAYVLVKSLMFVKGLGALNATKNSLNHNFIQGTPYEFFRERVKQIVLDDGEDCVGLSQIWPQERSQKIVRLCSKATGYDTLTLTEALMHEARHLEPNEHRHEMCLDGEMRGREACDSSYAEGGAYAVGIEYLIRISQTKHLAANLREQAKSLAARALQQRFNFTPTTSSAWLNDKKSIF